MKGGNEVVAVVRVEMAALGPTSVTGSNLEEEDRGLSARLPKARQDKKKDKLGYQKELLGSAYLMHVWGDGW